MTEAIAVGRAVPAEILCPTTGQVCPARELLHRFYTPSEAALSDPNLAADSTHPFFDAAKLAIKLSEHEAQAYLRDCGGPIEDGCPTRLAMDASQVRQTAVRGIRKLIHRNK